MELVLLLIRLLLWLRTTLLLYRDCFRDILLLIVHGLLNILYVWRFETAGFLLNIDVVLLLKIYRLLLNHV